MGNRGWVAGKRVLNPAFRHLVTHHGKTGLRLLKLRIWRQSFEQGREMDIKSRAGFATVSRPRSQTVALEQRILFDGAAAAAVDRKSVV